MRRGGRPTERRTYPIAVFDSGLGGISVLRELRSLMPNEHYLYFGDSANAPYGSRPTEEIRALTLENLTRLKQEYAFKAVVVACNTATSAAIGALRAAWPELPVVGIEPALKPAADRHPGGTVLVLATETTLREAKFDALACRLADRCRVVRLPCPGLVEFIERGETDSPALEAFLRQTLGDYAGGGADAVVLGCTHYPFAAEVLRRVLGPDTELLDGSEGTARNTRSQLAERSLLRETGEGSVRFLNSSPDPALLRLCSRPRMRWCWAAPTTPLPLRLCAGFWTRPRSCWTAAKAPPARPAVCWRPLACSVRPPRAASPSSIPPGTPPCWS